MNINFVSYSIFNKPLKRRADNEYKFKGCSSLPEIRVLQGVNSSFVDNVIKNVLNLPSKYLKDIRTNNFKLIFAKSINDGLFSEKLTDKAVLKTENDNFSRHFALTFSLILNPIFVWTEKGFVRLPELDKQDGAKRLLLKPFIIFANKLEFLDKYIPSVVSHEVGHAISNIYDLEENRLVQNAIKKDFAVLHSGKKADKLTEEEQKVVKKVFLDKNIDEAQSEAIADTLSRKISHLDCYGSDMFLEKPNPEFIPTIFPSIKNVLNIIF